MTDDEHTCPNCGHEFEDSTTTSTKERWEYTGTILALSMVLSLALIIVLTAAGVFTLNSISQAWFALYSTVVLMAATWTFGKQTLEAVREARGKGRGGN